MEKSEIIKKYKENLRLYEGFIHNKKVIGNEYFYKERIHKVNKIIDALENNTLTYEKFMKLDPRDKWDTHKYFDGKVIWLCDCGCGEETNEPESVFIGSLLCGHCGFELTRRTGGGQKNPFNWTFEYNIKELRKQKLEQIGK